MPAVALELQKRFKLTVIDGLPQVSVDVNGGKYTVMCCPLCGCIHILQGIDENKPYAPLCQTLPVVYKAQKIIWHKLYPEVVSYTALRLLVSSAK